MERKGAYPIILKQSDAGYYVDIPDFEIGTQGESIADAMEMARDAIGLMGIDMEDDNRKLPKPYSRMYKAEKDDIVTLVDIDFTEYRRRVDNRAVKKNCTIPYWMSVEADRAGINYSRLLQDAIAGTLGIQNQKIH